MTQPTLQRGSKGAAVHELQTKLQAVKFYDKKIDDDFGPSTEAAVKSFQKAHHLPDKGLVGPLTWKALDDEVAASTPPPDPPPPPPTKHTPLPAIDYPVVTRFLGQRAQGDPSASVQVAERGAFKLIWNVVGPYDQLTLKGSEKKVTGASGTLELTAEKDQVFTLEARNALGSDAKRVSVWVHKEEEPFSDHVYATLALSFKEKLLDEYEFLHKSLKYIKLEGKITLIAEGKLEVGKQLSEEEKEAAVGIDMESGYSEGAWKHAFGLQFIAKFGALKIEGGELEAKINSHGARVALVLKVKMFGASADVKFVLVDAEADDKGWETELMQLEVQIKPPPILAGELKLHDNIRVSDARITPEVIIEAKPDWARIAADAFKKGVKKVTEKALEKAIEKKVVEKVAEKTVETVTKEVVEAAVDDAASSAAEDVMMVGGVEILAAAGAVLAAAYIMVKTFEDMAQGDWNREAGKKVDDLAAAMLEGIRKGMFGEPEPGNESEKLGWKRGVPERKGLIAGDYKHFLEERPYLSKANADAEIEQEIRAYWGKVGARLGQGDMGPFQIHFWELCDRSARVAIWQAWVTGGKKWPKGTPDAVKDQPDWETKVWAFNAVFGKHPQADASQLQPWEKEAWDEFDN